jgi:hypothetical protein
VPISRRLIAAVAASLAALAAGRAQTTRFAPGERFVYDVKFSDLQVGQATLAIVGTDTIRGQSVVHALFAVKGGTFVYHVNDTTESWFDPATMTSYRFWQDVNEGGRHVHRRFEIFPDSKTMQQEGKAGPEPSVADPLDDASFLYFVRTQPLVVGQTYDYNRYFKPSINPVTVRVLRRERVTVPAGTFDAIVVQPIFKTSGIFSQGGHAEVWVSDDSQRAVLQIKSQLPIGSLNLFLKSKDAATGAGSSGMAAGSRGPETGRR